MQVNWYPLCRFSEWLRETEAGTSEPSEGDCSQLSESYVYGTSFDIWVSFTISGHVCSQT